MHRRQFLLSATAGIGFGTALSNPALAEAVKYPLPAIAVTLIKGVNASTPAPHLDTLLRGLTLAGHPVSVVIDPGSDDGEHLTADHPVAVTCRKHLTASPQLIELMPLEPDLTTKTPYFQGRAAFDAREKLIGLLNLDDSKPLLAAALQNIACHPQDKVLVPQGLRAAGFRGTWIVPEATAPVDSEKWDDGSLRMFGGAVAKITSAADSLWQPDKNKSLSLVYIDAGELAQMTLNDLSQAVTDFTDQALTLEVEGRITNLRPTEVALRDNFNFSRLVALHLFEPDPTNAALVQGVEAFKSDLAKAGLRFSQGQPNLAGTGYWIPLGPSEDDDHSPLQQFHGDGPDVVAASDSETAPLQAGIGVTLSNYHDSRLGLDGAARLRLPAVPAQVLIQATARNPMPRSEFVLTVPPEEIATAVARRTLFRKIAALPNDAVTQLVPLGDLANRLAPQSGLISRFRKTEAAQVNLRRGSYKPARDKDQLWQDAKLAWHFFEISTNTKTGLCAASVFRGPGGQSYHEAVTMWDVASHLNALMAAADIGLIDKQDFRKRVAQIMPNLRGRDSNGRRLPQEWIKTDRHRYGNRNFDACDTGRLLAAFSNLAQHSYSETDVSELVQSWSLADVIDDGELQSVIENKFVSVYKTHCAHYAALAFRRFGFQVSSPYEVFTGRSKADGQMALLHTADWIGAIGTEPMLLEAMDFGISPETGYLADTLFEAQRQEFEATGILTGVSESPIDRAPWFTYQGMKLADHNDTWTVDSPDPDEKYKTPEFRKNTRAIATKAAFLWAAHQPHDYSDRLVAHVRATAKTKFGYASSVYSKENTATANYSDINTNGIILQSIARLLKE